MGRELIMRTRRLRAHPAIRQLVRENQLAITDFIYPLFVHAGAEAHIPVSSMPGVHQHSLDGLTEILDEVAKAGIQAVLIFGLPYVKDEQGSEAWAEDGIVQKALRRAKELHPELYLISDVCLCEYTSHGHCGLVEGERILNDESVNLLVKIAVTHARAGADMAAPSDMMDGRVGAIRLALDEAGFENLPIMSYAAKYASSFYGPFRVAADSAPQFGDRSTYQMDPANGNEAIREILTDAEEGADAIIIKPAMAYGDILYRARQATKLPLAAYQVSGEYAMIKAAAERGFIDERRVAMEALVSLKRAGADMVISYYAIDAARWLAGTGD